MILITFPVWNLPLLLSNYNYYKEFLKWQGRRVPPLETIGKKLPARNPGGAQALINCPFLAVP